jgi:hypothetical protein
VVRSDSLEFDGADFVSDAVVSGGESLVDPRLEDESGDVIALEVRDFPDDVLPRADVQGDVVAGFAEVNFGDRVAALITEGNDEGEDGESPSVGAEPKREAVVLAPVFAVDGADGVGDRQRREPLERDVDAEMGPGGSGAESKGTRALKLPGAGTCEVVEQAGGEDGLAKPVVLGGVVEVRRERRAGLRVGCEDDEREKETHGKAYGSA